MRPIFTVVAICGLFASPIYAKDQDIKFGPPPGWVLTPDPLPVPDNVRGPIFLRQQDVQVHLDRSGQSSFISSMFRLLEPTALQLGNVTLTWNPAAGAPVVHAIKVYRNGVMRDVLATTQFEILRREDQLETAMLDGALTAVLRVPDLRVGDDLEVSYTLRTQDPTLGPDNAGLMYLAATPPPGRYNLRLSWDSQQEPMLRPTSDLSPQMVREAQAIRVSLDNPGPLNPPKSAPPRYNWQRLIEYSDFPTWQSVSGRIAPLFSNAAALPANSPIKHEAAEIAAASSDPMARAAAALKLVQQQVRYVYVGLNGGNLTPAQADVTWQRRYGDCKGKTALLLALLHELGVPAEAVLVSNNGSDDGMDARMPNPFMFDHVLVRAQIAGKVWWLDGTLPHQYHPTSEPVMPYRWVLPLSASGTALEANPWKPATKPDETNLYEIDARGGFEVPAKIRQISIKRGAQALVEYLQFSTVSDSQLESSFRQNLEGSSNWNAVGKVSWRFDSAELASILEISGTGPVDWETGSTQSRSLSLPGGGFSPPDRRQHGNDATSTVPFYTQPGFDCYVTTVRLPTATAEKDWSFNTTFNRVMYGKIYRRSFERRAGAIRMIRANRTVQLEVAPSVAAADNGQLSRFDNSMAWIYYDPASFGRSPASETVPATYDIDWERNPDACLAPQPAGK